MEMQQCINLNDGEFEVLNGFDEILLAGVACGCKGAVGSTYNYIPESIRAFWMPWSREILTKPEECLKRQLI